MLPRRPSHPLNQNHAALDVDPIVFELNFPASVVCSIMAHRRSARRCSNDGGCCAEFVHFFAAHAIVNSPLQCWVLDGQWRRLQNVNSLALTLR